MCVPLWNNKKVTGLIYVDSLIHENVFTQDDLSLLTSLANVAAIKLENAELLDEMIEKKRMEHELAQARKIQKEALPDHDPEIPGWDITGTNTPCYTVGCDYYDFIPRPDGRLAFVLADVSGKGAPAAMMMMVLRAAVHSAVQQKLSVGEILSHTNLAMFDNSPAQSYVTFFLGDIGLETESLARQRAFLLPLSQLLDGGRAIAERGNRARLSTPTVRRRSNSDGSRGHPRRVHRWHQRVLGQKR
jgi:hypothetical protein